MAIQLVFLATYKHSLVFVSCKTVVRVTVVSILWLGVNNACSFISIVYMHHQTHNKAVPTQIYVYKEHQMHSV